MDPSVVALLFVTALVAGGAAALGAGLLARRAQHDADRRSAHERDALVRQLTVASGEHLRSVLLAGSKDLDQHGRAIDRQVAAMGRGLQEVHEAVGALQRDRAAQHGELVARLAEATTVSRRLDDATGALREALASPTARGRWGERLAEDVLRVAGLHEGVSYVKHAGTAAGRVPDFTFPLGEERVLHMDVKFPLTNYLRHLEAPDEATRAEAAAAFLRDVRARVKELDGRAYADPQTTVGFLLLFIPNEAVYGFVHEQDPDLLDDALRADVVLCSPSTLFAVLAVVRQAHEDRLLERTSQEVLECLGGFTDQWERFCAQVDKVGRSLETAHTAFGDLAGTRRRQLQRQVDRVDDLRRRRGLLDEHGRAAGEVPAAGEVTPFRLDAG